jgi:tRNA(fMet)-specific endonuclease VapC
VAELRYDAERKASRKLHHLIDTFIEAVEVAAFDELAAVEFGRIGSEVAEQGIPIGEFDVLIAAHALALRCILVSNNVKHFSRVPGLLLENWV